MNETNNQFRFVDLFAGIGGFHLAMHNIGAECVFAAEWDEHARKTYEQNFRSISPGLFLNDGKNFAGDITLVNKEDIPDFDILCAGFPCQPFSQAGHKRGFDDVRGTLFFDIAEILRIKRPRAFFLENVRHLLKHDDGKTFSTIMRVLEELGYKTTYQIVRASDHGLPQHRPRIFIIGFLDQNAFFNFPLKRELGLTMSDVMGGHVDRSIGFTLRVGGKSSPIDDRRNWDGYLVDNKVRRLTPEEGKKMQGFPSDFVFPVSRTEAMKQLGNSVAVPAVQDWAQEIVNTLNRLDLKHDR